MSEETKTPDTFAIVELMGHVKMAGRLSEEERFGCKLGRLDVPNAEGGFTTIFFGGASVYRISIVSEAVALHVARSSPARPVSPWDFPKMLPGPAQERNEERDGGIQDDRTCQGCGCVIEDCECQRGDDYEDEHSDRD